MNHLTDFEELITRIENPAVANYMHEAMACYMASAYRGCIVMSFIALFDDLLSKLGELACVNKEARRIYQRALKLQEDQKVFERFLIGELSRTRLIPELDASTLEIIRQRRNRAAHPSGHHPSAEEARFIFFTTIDRFLSQPLLRTKQLVEELAARLGNKYFFTSESVSANADIVRGEIKLLHREGLPALVSMLAEKTTGELAAGAQNAVRFLAGLAGLDEPHINQVLQSRLISPKTDDQRFSQVVLSLVAANGKLAAKLEGATALRLKEVLADQIRELKRDANPNMLKHPARFLISLLDSGQEELLEQTFAEEAALCLQKFPFISFFGPVLGCRSVFRDHYASVLLEHARSIEFEQANDLARATPELDGQLAELLCHQECFSLVLGVLEAARHGAFASQDLKNGRFAAIPLLKEKAAIFLRERQDELKEWVPDQKLRSRITEILSE